MLSELFIGGDPFISGFPGPIQMVMGICSEVFDDDDGDVSSVSFGTLEWD